MKRNENETFDDYKVRRAAANAATRQALKPKMFWNPKEVTARNEKGDPISIKGTYVKPQKDGV